MSERKPLVVFHKSCSDGFGAMWCFWRQFGNEYEYVPGTYTANDFDIELFRDRVVFLVDFSYKRAVVEEIIKVAKSVTLIDHHVSALKDLEGIQGLDFANSCIEYSGAMLAWGYLNPGTNAPKAIVLIDDRDRWTFRHEDTKPFSQYLFSIEYDIEEWDKVLRYAEDPDTLAFYVSQGEAIERKHMKDVRELMKYQRPMQIGEWCVPVLNVPYTMASDAGEQLCQHSFNEDNGDPPPFAAPYYDSANGRHFSLRSLQSNPDAVDVSVVASSYGGGGHRNASGFTVPRDHGLAKS